MPWQGNQFVRTDGTRTGSTVWQQAQAASVDIISTDHDTHDEDQAQGITDCINRNGANTVAADINWGNFKIIGLGAGTANGDAVNKGQMDAADGTLQGNIDSLSATVDTKLANVVEDTSPQLGGALDVNGNAIVSVTNGAIDITPNGTGRVIVPRLTLAGVTYPDADGTANQVLTTDGAGAASWQDLPAFGPFTEYGESADQTLAAGTRITVAYSALTPALTGEAKVIAVTLKVINANSGWAVGDKLYSAMQVEDGLATGTSFFGFQAFKNATSVGLMVGADGIRVVSGTAGSWNSTINLANWRAVISAWR